MGLRILTPPTCVGLRYGHITRIAKRGFSWHLGSATLRRSAPSSRALMLVSGFACSPIYTSSTGMPSPVSLTLVRPPMARLSGSGILTGFPSPTPLGLGLGTDLPCADRLDAGNLRLSARRVLTCVLATYADRVNSIRSTRPSGTASLRDGTLSYHRKDPAGSKDPKLRYAV
jgi:hypothetical protein